MSRLVEVIADLSWVDIKQLWIGLSYVELVFEAAVCLRTLEEYGSLNSPLLTP
jgi:hypothetical protein